MSDLEGDLGSFPPDILFQMMSLGQLDGRLTLEGPSGTSRVYFQRGRLTFAAAPGSSDRLGEELVRCGRIDRRARDAAARTWKSGGGVKRIGTILVERGDISRAELETFVRERIKDAIYEVMEWREGRFLFERGVQPRSEDILLDVSLESLLLECMTRLDHARRERDETQRA